MMRYLFAVLVFVPVLAGAQESGVEITPYVGEVVHPEHRIVRVRNRRIVAGRDLFDAQQPLGIATGDPE